MSIYPLDPHGPLKLPPGDRRGRLVALYVVGALALLLVGALAVHYAGARYTVLAVGGLTVLILGLWRVEVLYLVAFAGAYFYEAHWKIVILPVVGVLILRALLTGSPPRRWWPLVPYLLALLASLIFDPAFPGTASTILSYVVGPALALVTAAVATSPKRRMVLLLMPVPFALLQVPVAVIQAYRLVSRVGAGAAAKHGDLVTGTLGASKSGVVMLVAVAAAVIISALALEKLVNRWIALALCAFLLSVGLLSHAFAILFVAPISLGTVFLASLIMHSERRLRRMLQALVVVIVSVPLLLVVGNTVYPGWAHNVAGIGRLRAYLFHPSTPGYGAGGRLLILQRADGLARSEGVATAVLGVGFGATRPDAVRGVHATGRNVVVSEAQLASGVWVPQLLIEAGYAAVVSFFLLLLGVGRISLSAARRAPPRSFDAAAALAMTGMLAFMVLVSFYAAGPVQPAIATGFWVLIGVVMAIPDRAPPSGHPADVAMVATAGPSVDPGHEQTPATIANTTASAGGVA